MSAALELRGLDGLMQAEAARAGAHGGDAEAAGGRDVERWRRALKDDPRPSGRWPEWRVRGLCISLNGEAGDEAGGYARELLANAVREARLEWLWARAGIAPAVAMLLHLGAVRITDAPEAGGFWQPSDAPAAWGRGAGKRVITLPVTAPPMRPAPDGWDERAVCIDIIALDPSRPSWWASRRGVAEALPELPALGWDTARPLRVHPHPLAWLQAGCDGIVPLGDAALEPYRLAGRTLLCASPKHADALSQRVEAMRDAVLPAAPRYKVANKAQPRENEREAA